MFDALNEAIGKYLIAWQELVGQRKNKEFFERLRPIGVGWKVADLAEFDRLFHEWRDACDHIHLAWLNDRWLAVMHLKDSKLHGDIELIKLMQRRPNSNDQLGLDNVDFLDMEQTNTKAVLAEESLKWTEEKNGLCEWTSIWFGGTEAKLRSETSFDVAIAEFQAVNNKIRGDKFNQLSHETGAIMTEVE